MSGLPLGKVARRENHPGVKFMRECREIGKIDAKMIDSRTIDSIKNMGGLRRIC
jgi:hypothetical protein